MPALIYLVSAIFDLYLFVLAIRIILAYSRANYFNPLTQVIIKLTQPIVAPLRRMLPTVRGIELASVFWLIVIGMIKIVAIQTIVIGHPFIIAAFITAIMGALRIFLSTFFYAILLQALMSWFQPGSSPAMELLTQITAPIMRPIRRFIPPINGIDLSPIPALIALQFFILLLR